MFYKRCSNNLLLVYLATLSTAIPYPGFPSGSTSRTPGAEHQHRPSTNSTTSSKSIPINPFSTPDVLAGKTFDYVIVGGGTTGLVLASHLSKDASKRVAVIEAGKDGGEVMHDHILPPARAYLNTLSTPTSDYDWHYQTTPQRGLDGRQVFLPRWVRSIGTSSDEGKVLGGSSAVNHLYMVQQSKIEQDAWADQVGTEDWSWNTLYPYLKKTENYSAPLHIDETKMVVDENVHGKGGPIHYSYPGYNYPSLDTWIDTLGHLGIESRDPGGGNSYGAFIAPSSINPDGWERSYAKNGYLDPVADRPHLVVLTGHQVTKINFNGTTATSVSFASGANRTVYTVSATKEIILCAGAIGTPQLLLVSGVGPRSQLEALQIPIVMNLPGVGKHLRDHLSGSLTFDVTGRVDVTAELLERNATFAAQQMTMWQLWDPSSLYNAPDNALAYLNLTTLLGPDNAEAFLSQLREYKPIAVAGYSNDESVQKGYDAVYDSEVNTIYPSVIGGIYGNSTLTLSLQASLQHPLSRGSITINSTSTFSPPVIDPGYLTHPGDIQVFREAFKFARKVSQTPPLSTLVVTEITPGTGSVSSDEEWEDWIRNSTTTSHHPTSTCSMLPLSLGGVVDLSLRVYNLIGLRIVDASVIPISMSAHPTAPLYGLAERASELILNTAWVTVGSEAASTRSKSSGTKPSSTMNKGKGSNFSGGNSLKVVGLHRLFYTLVAFVIALIV
ncbi:BZ3500_MvSof-1268-A1-R1_Chr3-1g05774 [Microbotryum saponariae]|uniref:BZ3500_MvSof-1268-A1-R1_Chr3-1g05774 protein n=1 Tax=Microbotryum saponariae TaxID=289078 RepID=A0A2X0LRY7_9BASI|nr:BZ3500_MvSof-1268-A1-R1_Chr3-1g05774 [Microbotryum saponariae]SDA04964.1 BZ3501_MvSof-1269-A2-R1_Chr3-1g05444 [Microbotryum saponariae]